MKNYLFINSKDPFEDVGLESRVSLMLDLLEEERHVELLLVQDGVYASRNSYRNALLSEFMEKGGRIHVDEFSLAVRGLPTHSVRTGVIVNPISIVVDAMLEQYKVVWN